MVRGGYLYILGSKCQGHNGTFQHFGSGTITWVVFSIQLSYFIHICRMVRGRYLYILGSKGQGHNGTLSTLWDWHNNLSSFQRTDFIHRYRMVREMYLYILRSGGESYHQKITVIVTDPWRGPFWLSRYSSSAMFEYTAKCTLMHMQNSWIGNKPIKFPLYLQKLIYIYVGSQYLLFHAFTVWMCGICFAKWFLIQL